MDDAGAVYLPERLHAVRIAREEAALRASNWRPSWPARAATPTCAC